jgi:hypothetical protein
MQALIRFFTSRINFNTIEESGVSKLTDLLKTDARFFMKLLKDNKDCNSEEMMKLFSELDFSDAFKQMDDAVKENQNHKSNSQQASKKKLNQLKAIEPKVEKIIGLRSRQI